MNLHGTRSGIAVSLFLVLASALAQCRGRAPASVADAPPNVILISIDTLRADRLNSYGYAARRVSPNIDALAKDGILFENHITTSPWTTPAHLSLLTSLYPSSHGVISSFDELRQSFKKDRRYARLPEARVTLAEALASRGYAAAAFTAGITLDPRIGFDQGFSGYDTSMYKLDAASLRKLEHWVDRRGAKPFFLFWHTFEVHAPYLQTTYLADVLPPEKARAVKNALVERAILHARNEAPGFGVRKILEEHDVLTPAVCDALYMGGVRSADEWVGKFLALLRQRGLYDRALIVFTSDHGEELGGRSAAQAYDGHGHSLYAELVHVPLIVKLPGQRRAGTRVKAVSSAVDVMPTILDVLSIAGPQEQMQGRSLRGLWQGRSVEPRAAYVEALGASFEKKSVRDERYKYILSIGDETVARFGRRHVPQTPDARELYDLLADPGERVDLLASPGAAEYAHLAGALDQALRAHLARQKGEADSVVLAPETVENLKSLGYLH